MVKTPTDQPSQSSSPPQRPLLYEDIMDHLPLGVFLVSTRGQVVFVSTRMAQFVGASQETLAHTSYHALFQSVINMACRPDKAAQALDTAVLSIKHDPVVQLSLRGESERQIEIRFFPLQKPTPDAPAWGGVALDRSQEVRRLTENTQLAEDQIQDARRRLASIQGQLRALATHQFQWGEEMMRDLYQDMETALEDVTEQVDHGLDLLQLQNEGIIVYPREADLESLIRDVLDAWAVENPGCRVEFQTEDDLPPVRVDAQRIKKVLHNILRDLCSRSESSAVLHLRGNVKGKQVQLDLSHDSSHGEEHSVKGPHLAGDQAGDADHDLVISRGLIEAHGGKLWTSGEEAGRPFAIHFTLPLMPRQRQIQIQDQPVTGRERKAGTILVADADSDQLTLLTSVLKEEGYRVLAAADGPAIIDITQSATPDLIILEWDLPGMNGLRATKYIRRWSSIPIIMLTSRTNPDNLLDAFDAGVDDFLTKPVMADELLARINALQRRQQHTEVDFEEQIFEARGLRINFDSQLVWRHGEPIDLTPTEYTLLTYMVNHRRQVLPHRQLIEHTWEATEKGSRRGLFVHISRLRDKLEDDPDHPELIVTRWGVGYIFMPTGS